MDQLLKLERLSEPEKDALIVALWAEGQRLTTQLAALGAKAQAPRKDAHHASVRPSTDPEAEPCARSTPGDTA